ncbi:hypothetical protein RIR_jg30488.t1 [Rhizophagus irregularis DAOM 181602=DAOM 197198]|nr:hypothetical protein RIR_jg30488.t1 [Rhizophagus irregularis DAOM 181602=DAOM 197198]
MEYSFIQRKIRINYYIKLKSHQDGIAPPNFLKRALHDTTFLVNKEAVIREYGLMPSDIFYNYILIGWMEMTNRFVE